MGEMELTTTEAILYVALINAGIGLILGLIPLGFGVFRGKLKLGIVGIIATIIGGAIFGVFLSVPAMAIFTWLIVRSRSDGPLNKVDEIRSSSNETENNVESDTA